VIASSADLDRAMRLRRPPDLFELRLDALYPVAPAAAAAIATLQQPLIATARHPSEGGGNNLSAAERRRLLLHFLPQAASVDVELRSAASLRSVLDQAREEGKKLILSFHDLRQTPPDRALDNLARRAHTLSANVLKIATRADTVDDLARLLRFFARWEKEIPLSVMGIGKRGREARLTLLRRGSVLTYVHLGTARIAGQLSLAQARRQFAAGRRAS
jgi:3-dehydroquinate dehydratase-1